jgi:methyl-accepting chemotaxis protein
MTLRFTNLQSQTQTVSAASEEQSASMEEIAASSNNLAKLAQELQNAVSNFGI